MDIERRKPILSPLYGAAVLPPLATTSRRQGDPVESRRKIQPKQNPVRKATADRFGVINSFVDISLRDLSAAEIGVWLILWRDSRNGIAKTGYASLAERAGCSRSTVKRAVGRLQQRKLLVKIVQGSQTRGVSQYRVVAIEREQRGEPMTREPSEN